MPGNCLKYISLNFTKGLFGGSNHFVNPTFTERASMVQTSVEEHCCGMGIVFSGEITIFSGSIVQKQTVSLHILFLFPDVYLPYFLLHNFVFIFFKPLLVTQKSPLENLITNLLVRN